jgi:homoserine kinase type II
MSVYTTISESELIEFLSHYDAGALQYFEGIQSGIENTNYFVDTDRGRYVLTIFEHHSADELRFFLDLTAFLAEHGIASAHPRPSTEGDYLSMLKNKPAALVNRLAGGSVEQPSVAQCSAVGNEMARLHLVGQDFWQSHANERGPAWWHQTSKALHGRLSADEETLLNQELAYQASARALSLPRGIIHADLFRDNVLFEQDRLSGLIDFYYACTDALLYDVAVTVNDWCCHEDGSLDQARTSAMLAAYAAVRPINDDEHQAWPVMLRAAALRFWLSRLFDMHFPRPGEMTHTKDPNAFRRILMNRAGQPVDNLDYWPKA